MAQKQHMWVSILPYGKTADGVPSYMADYADAVVADDTAKLQVAVLTLPFYGDLPLQPTLLPSSAFTEVGNGGEIYCVGVPFGNCEGGWLNPPTNTVHREQSIIVADALVAHILGKGYNQQSILRVSAIGSAKGTDGYLYLLKDSPANRGIALSVAGGYTGGGGYLLVASTELLPADAIGDYDCIPATLALLTL